MHWIRAGGGAQRLRSVHLMKQSERCDRCWTLLCIVDCCNDLRYNSAGIRTSREPGGDGDVVGRLWFGLVVRVSSGRTGRDRVNGGREVCSLCGPPMHLSCIGGRCVRYGDWGYGASPVAGSSLALTVFCYGLIGLFTLHSTGIRVELHRCDPEDCARGGREI